MVFPEWMRSYYYLFSAPQILDQHYVSEYGGSEYV